MLAVVGIILSPLPVLAKHRQRLHPQTTQRDELVREKEGQEGGGGGVELIQQTEKSGLLYFFDPTKYNVGTITDIDEYLLKASVFSMSPAREKNL